MIALNKFENNVASINISGDILPNDYKMYYGDDITVPKDVREFLKENGDAEIVLNINSGGGDVFSGTEIANIIKFHKGKTTANIESIAGSIASVIAMSCDEIKMPKNSYLMIHKPFVIMTGDADDLRANADLLDKIQDNIEDVYDGKALEGVTKDQIKRMVNNTTWFTGEEAKQYFKIELLDEVKVLNCTTNLEFEDAPSFLFNQNIEENKFELSNVTKERIKNLKKI